LRFLKEVIIKFFFLLNFLAALYALLVFQISYSADIKHWFGGFLTLTVPVAFAVNIFFLVTYIIIRSWKFILSLVILVIGYPLLARTFKFNFSSNSELVADNISVLSYNVMYCDFETAKRSSNITNSGKLVTDLDSIKADIKCFQELYNSPNHPQLNVIKRLREKNRYYTYMHSKIDDKAHIGTIGLAIFSKYPIIHKEEISWKTNNNGLLVADIVYKEDTIRIMNLQFKSMGIRMKKAITRNGEVRNKETRTILGQLKAGFKDRALQVDIIEAHIKNSPYPVILAGDFNELPYGYAYGRVRKLLGNAFEGAGFGFGFTYHKMPSFIRIDNQFYDKNAFEILDFQTLMELGHSDHYPIYAEYKLN
jgi:endonuclease/exonuclease/phosphatase family metal-dependent hydrolase